MKKSLLLTLSTVAFAASAATLNPVQPVSAEAELEATALASVESVKAAPAISRAGTDDVVGEYLWSYKSGLSKAIPTNGIVTVAAGLEDGTVNVRFEYNDSSYVTVVGNYDEAAGKIIINPVIVNKTTATTYYKLFTQYSWPAGSSPVAIDDPIELTVVGNTLAAKPGLVLGMGAINVETGESGGYYFLTYSNFFYGNDLEFETVAEEVPFIDNFFSPMFGKGNIETTVTVAQAKGTPGLFAVNGFLNAMFTGLPSVIIDATNPDRVHVPVQSSGITATGRGLTWFASASVTTSDPNSPLTYPGDSDHSCNITYTLENGKGVINFPQGSCRFGWVTYNPGSWYYNSSTADTKLEFTFPTSGVSNIIEDATDAPVEYYNLQGVKIAEPAQGTIVIRRQGSKVTKELVR